MSVESTEIHRSQFMRDVMAETPNGEQLVHCLQCGSCGGSCPNGPEMDYTPRAIFAMIAANRRDDVLASNTMWCCVSCYFCTARCPQEIPITETMYTLKRMAIREGKATEGDAPALARTFTGFVDKYGRAFEVGIATRYLMLNKPVSMLKGMGMGMSMFARGRLSLRPTKIRQTAQLQAIISKARELGKPEKRSGGAS
jgi:heterodisulfide reductase subunit C